MKAPPAKRAGTTAGSEMRISRRSKTPGPARLMCADVTLLADEFPVVVNGHNDLAEQTEMGLVALGRQPFERDFLGLPEPCPDQVWPSIAAAPQESFDLQDRAELIFDHVVSTCAVERWTPRRSRVLGLALGGQEPPFDRMPRGAVMRVAWGALANLAGASASPRVPDCWWLREAWPTEDALIALSSPEEVGRVVAAIDSSPLMQRLREVLRSVDAQDFEDDVRTVIDIARRCAGRHYLVAFEWRT